MRNKLAFRNARRSMKDYLVYLLTMAAVAAVAISSVIAVYAGNQFVLYTGAKGSGVYYFGVSLAISAGVYVIYFLATYVGFKRGVDE